MLNQDQNPLIYVTCTHIQKSGSLRSTTAGDEQRGPVPGRLAKRARLLRYRR